MKRRMLPVYEEGDEAAWPERMDKKMCKARLMSGWGNNRIRIV